MFESRRLKVCKGTVGLVGLVLVTWWCGGGASVRFAPGTWGRRGDIPCPSRRRSMPRPLTNDGWILGSGIISFLKLACRRGRGGGPFARIRVDRFLAWAFSGVKPRSFAAGLNGGRWAHKENLPGSFRRAPAGGKPGIQKSCDLLASESVPMFSNRGPGFLKAAVWRSPMVGQVPGELE